LVRSKGKTTILAAVGFGLLVLISLGQIVLALPPLTRQFFLVGQWLAWVLNCCCSILDMAAIVCLIVAIWQAVSGTDAGDVAQEVAYTVEPLEEEMVVEAFEEAPEETPYATMVLEETLEGEILEDTPVESPYTTQVLPETQEEAAEEGE